MSYNHIDVELVVVAEKTFRNKSSFDFVLCFSVLFIFLLSNV